jgi:hypothetical protein
MYKDQDVTTARSVTPPTPNPINGHVYLNLLTMTAMISSTSTVIMAMVISRFVAILSSIVSIFVPKKTCSLSKGARGS